MSRKLIKAISEQTETILTKFTEEMDYSIQDITDQFVLFAGNYGTFEDALDNLPVFVDEYYAGADVNKFKDTIRSGYSELVDGLIESSRRSLEQRVLRVI